jgi:hypothetical protein
MHATAGLDARHDPPPIRRHDRQAWRFGVLGLQCLSDMGDCLLFQMGAQLRSDGIGQLHDPANAHLHLGQLAQHFLRFGR